MSDSLSAVRLADYERYPFAVRETRLAFDIHPGRTTVTNEMTLERTGESASLRLDGIDVELESVRVDGRELTGNEYAIDDESLTIFDLPEKCVVSTRVGIVPEDNTALEGLYRSRTMYCTQCEAEGFRKITYFPDRPDVLSSFSTTITADASAYPTLLSNGNLVADSTRDGRRTVTWQDPHLKPAYLFALVAGDLAVLEDEFVTASGRRVELKIYSEPHNIDQCDYAMGVLKRAMRWDEERFGREYDLDIFMVVAVEDFNMGAMENKGLNIFNTSCVLATPDTATDAGHQRVEGVVAHEYFHNWSGNRVTCRDWFQLSLKEGFTVFRDAEFSSDMNSRTVKRVEDVAFLKGVQFVEDASPLAHSVRPDSYVEISNFYTTTIYEKGAEVVGMLATILGRDAFRAGSDLYFDRHDGQAVTTDDFVIAMEDASGKDLETFRHWYAQAGTPRVAVAESRDSDRLTLELSQSTPTTPGQNEKLPLHLPLALGVVDGAGREVLGKTGADNGFDVAIATTLDVENPNADGTLIAHLKDANGTIELTGIPADVEVSFLRGFSAPVNVDYPRSAASLGRLAARDTDGFARWDAAMTLMAGSILSSLDGASASLDAVHGMVTDVAEQTKTADGGPETRALLAAMLVPPPTTLLLDQAPGSDILAIDDARDRLCRELADALDWEAIVKSCDSITPYRATGEEIARRRLRSVALAYLATRLDQSAPLEARALWEHELERADNLTERLAGLVGLFELTSLADEAKQAHADAFYSRWSSKALVVDAWFSQQVATRFGSLDRLHALEAHEAFDIKNPNKARALYMGFINGNIRGFHAADGSGYRWLADKVIEIDALNPQVASRFAKTLTQWQRHNDERQDMMRGALARIAASGPSKDVAEVAEKGQVV